MVERSMGDMAGRVLLTLIGAAGLIVGAFMEWFHGMAGTHLSLQALYTHPFRSETHLPATVGFAVIVLAFLALVGLATSGWLTRLAGALGIVVFILLIIQLYLPHSRFLPGPGPWLVLAGGMVAAVGGG
jgi:hypothetical protein